MAYRAPLATPITEDVSTGEVTGTPQESTTAVEDEFSRKGTVSRSGEAAPDAGLSAPQADLNRAVSGTGGASGAASEVSQEIALQEQCRLVLNQAGILAGPDPMDHDVDVAVANDNKGNPVVCIVNSDPDDPDVEAMQRAREILVANGMDVQEINEVSSAPRLEAGLEVASIQIQGNSAVDVEDLQELVGFGVGDTLGEAGMEGSIEEQIGSLLNEGGTAIWNHYLDLHLPSPTKSSMPAMGRPKKRPTRSPGPTLTRGTCLPT